MLIAHHASQIFGQIREMELLLEKSKKTYIDYDRYLRPGYAFKATDDDVKRFENEIGMFLATCTTDAQQLKKICEKNVSLNESHLKHCFGIVSFLLERLFSMTQTFQEMKKERETFTLNPFKLLTGHLITRIPEQISEEKSVAKDVPRAKKDVLTIPAEFAERFSSEVVRPQQQKKLAEIASVHKSKFMKESQYLRQRFSKELEETEKMEQNVSQVTRLTSRLAQILAVQSEQVGEMHGKTASATNIVKQTEEELLLAVRRSESSQTYMSLLIVGLALLLLVIDYFTP